MGYILLQKSLGLNRGKAKGLGCFCETVDLPILLMPSEAFGYIHTPRMQVIMTLAT